jgi:anti-anti-sigma factor
MPAHDETTSVSSGFTIEAQPGGGSRSIALEGELDAGAAPVLLEAFERLLDGTDPGAEPDYEVTIDMSRLTFIDSAGLRALIGVERRARERRLPVQLVPPPPALTELLRTTGLTERVTLGPRDGAPPDAGFVERAELTLAADACAPAAARAEVLELAELLGEEWYEVARLLVSELVTNAVVHPGDDDLDDRCVGLRITTAATRLRVDVTDGGCGFDPARPEPRDPEYGGRGLLLVDRLATAWGAGPEPDGRFAVWFELDLAQAPAGLAA